jgi:hypothetical protein
VLAARVAATVQVPVAVAFKTPPMMLQPAVPAEITANEYKPEPDPPEAERVKPVAYTPLNVVNETDACVAWVIAKLTGARVIA